MKTQSASSLAGCMQKIAGSIARIVKYSNRMPHIPGDENFQKLFLSLVENGFANSQAIAAMYQTQAMTVMVAGEAGALASDMDVLTPESTEPPTGSIVLLHGETGTAVQSHFSDGLYHSSTGKTYSYADLFAVNTSRPPILVYRAPEDES